MMDELERVTTTVYNGYFVDLYVRVSNRLAIDMYEGLGYSVYRCVQEYYSAGPGELEEDAYGKQLFSLCYYVVLIYVIDMRKPMKRDKKRQSVRENGREFKVQPHEVY